MRLLFANGPEIAEVQIGTTVATTRIRTFRQSPAPSGARRNMVATIQIGCATPAASTINANGAIQGWCKIAITRSARVRPRKRHNSNDANDSTRAAVLRNPKGLCH